MNTPYKVKPTILLVDDNANNLQILAKNIMSQNYRISIASSGKKAIELAQRIKPDLIILDILMPEMDGFQVCHLLKSNDWTSHIPVIFISALHETENIVQGFNVGGIDYITKPFRKEELLARISTHLELKHAKDILLQQKNELQKLNDLKNKVFSIVGHDLRGPIGGINKMLKLLIDNFEKTNPEKLNKSLVAIQNATNSSYLLLENLLMWGNSLSGKTPLKIQKIKLHKVITEEIEILNEILQQKSIHCQMNVDREMEMYADENMLRTCIRNLISNSIKFSFENSIIEISAHQPLKYTYINIKDYGTGMTTEQITDILNKDLNTSTLGTNKEKGSGIGLSLVQEFIEKHGGRLNIESKVGLGSLFQLVFPSSISEHVINSQTNDFSTKFRNNGI